MRLFRFDPEIGRNIGSYQSSGFIVSSIVHLIEEAVIHCAYLQAGGVIGFHQAAAPQLFLVVQGEGWVRGASPERISIKAGQAAYWGKGEWHESGTEAGLTVILIEGGDVDPAKLMPPV